MAPAPRWRYAALQYSLSASEESPSSADALYTPPIGASAAGGCNRAASSGLGSPSGTERRTASGGQWSLPAHAARMAAAGAATSGRNRNCTASEETWPGGIASSEGTAPQPARAS